MTVLEVREPADEAGRIAAVEHLAILDTPPDGAFDRITALAARLFDVPIAIVSIVDTDRIWFKSRHGLPPEVTEIDRLPGLCASAIVGSEPWIVTDAANDPRTLANPLVAEAFGLRFYAGIPLTTETGHNLGTLCVIDKKPREASPEEIASLRDLAALVMAQLELRIQARDVIRLESELRRDAEDLLETLQTSLLPQKPLSLPGLQVASRFVAGEQGLTIGGDFFDVFPLTPQAWGMVLGDVCGKGVRAASLTALARWTVRASAAHRLLPSEVLCDLNDALISEGDADDHFCTVALARIELDTNSASVTLATSGHPLPMLLRQSGVVELRGEASLPVGMFPTVAPVDDTFGLTPGDSLVFYTDGITEARNGTGDLFGEEGLLDALRTCVGRSAKDIATHVVDAARAFSARGLDDDAAVLVVRFPDETEGPPGAHSLLGVR